MKLLLSSPIEIELLSVTGMNFEEDDKASVVESDEESIAQEKKL